MRCSEQVPQSPIRVVRRWHTLTMKRIALIFLSAVSVISARAEELRIARFDAQRVFDQYQHTTDLEKEISVKRNTRLSGPESERLEARLKLKDRVDDFTAKLREATAGTPERERLAQQLQIATLEQQIDGLARAIEGLRREQTLKAESQSQRAGIIREIWAEAAVFATENRYSLVIPDGLGADGPFVSIVVTGKFDDITDSLLTRLNKRYSSKATK